MAIVHGRTERPMTRRYAAGLIALRPSQDGRIAGYVGLDEYRETKHIWHNIDPKPQYWFAH